MVIEILVTLSQPVDALADQAQQRMLDALGIARVGQDFGQGLGQTNPPVGLAQQWDAAVAGHVPASETGAERALLYGWKVEEFRVTNCARRSGGFRFHSTQ